MPVLGQPSERSSVVSWVGNRTCLGPPLSLSSRRTFVVLFLVKGSAEQDRDAMLLVSRR